jgi:6-pyruvoyltetrahydropterin/6-carboxytetrahydropterin synthase
MLMFITRKAEFSASHVCRIPEFSDAENRRLFGDGANPNGHGHNYIVEVTVEGEPDEVTGMVMDLKSLKDILEEEVVGPMDHRFLNREVPPFDQVIPTTENVAQEIWRRLEPRLSSPSTKLAKVRLFETDDLYVDVEREAGAAWSR